MHNLSRIEEDVITEELFLDLSNVVSIYLKNISSEEVQFGLETIPGGKTIPVDLNGTMLSEGARQKISFPRGSGKLFYRIVRFVNYNCK